MLRRFSKKNKNPSDGASSSSSNNDDVTRKQKKLLTKFLDFITSSIWSIPIASFIEAQSVVFDRQQMETDIYVEIHKEYSQLIDTLIECFCDDVGTTPTELVEAIGLFNQKDVSQKYKVALEPLLAAQNFNVFVPMMMRKNIELQLQALQMIEFMCGLIPSVLQLEDGETLKNMKKLTPEETERYVLISVLRHSKDEYDAMHKSEEMEQMARNSRIQREALEQEIRKEEILLQKALDEGVRSRTQEASTQANSSTGTSSLRSVAAIMAATFSIDTGTSTDDVKVELVDEPKKATSSSGTMTSSMGVDMGTGTDSVGAKKVLSGLVPPPPTAAGINMGTDSIEGREGRPKSAKKTSSSGTMTSSGVGVEMGTDPIEEKGREGRPKSAKRVGSAVGKRSKPKDASTGEDGPQDGEAEAQKEKRPGTSSKKNSLVSTGANTELPETASKGTGGSPETAQDKEKPKRPGTAKGPNERKYSNAGLEDLVGPQEPKSRPSTRKTSRDDNRPPSRKTTTSHEPRAKTPLQKGNNNEDRPTTRRSSVDKNAPKRNDSVPRERRSSMSQKDEGDKKPPKPMGPIRSNKYDGEVVLGRPMSPGRDHGPRRKNLNDVNSHLVDGKRLDSSDVRSRAQYLKEQRDKLLQMKNEERIKQMNDIQKSSLERPKTAARAREILDKKKKEEAEGTIRKEISDKLKTQILTLN